MVSISPLYDLTGYIKNIYFTLNPFALFSEKKANILLFFNSYEGSQDSTAALLLNSISGIIICSVFYFLLKNIFKFSLRWYLCQFFLIRQERITFAMNCFRNNALAAIFVRQRTGYETYIIADGIAVATSLTLVVISSLYFQNYIINYQEDLTISSCTISYLNNLNLFKWISYLFDYINFGFLFDNLTLLMLIIVLSISTLVHYYSIDYMYSDPRLLTFLKYLSGFTVSMLVLISANNYVLLFLGWEGVGIFSYLLIGFWYTRTLALKASLKAVIVNKLGDIALLIALGLLINYFGTADYLVLSNLINYLYNYKISGINLNFFNTELSLLFLISLFLLIAAVGKSAQFGLHVWLPDAMEGPTPVSALIHAATMVTAGVYLIVRSSFIFEYVPTILNLVIIIGGFTALFGAFVACFQYDIKKIIAFSTCSQIGYMFLACGLSAYHTAMFHLFTHAFFKALLFLCAGSVIHAISDQQDIWKMGGLFKVLPITFVGISIGLLSLMGLPFTSGFYSKDSIIELAYSKNTIVSLYGFLCSLLAAFLTAFYCYRMLFYVFFSQTKVSRSSLYLVHESKKEIITVIYILVNITIFIGFFFKHSLNTPFSFFYYSPSVSLHKYNSFIANSENFIFYYVSLKILIFLTPVTALLLSYLYYKYNNFNLFFDAIYLEVTETLKISTNFCKIGYNFWYCFQSKGSLDFIYNLVFVKPLLDFSYRISYQELDRGWLEFFFVKVPSLAIFKISKILNTSFVNPTLMFLPPMLYISTISAYVLYIFI